MRGGPLKMESEEERKVEEAREEVDEEGCVAKSSTAGHVSERSGEKLAS